MPVIPNPKTGDEFIDLLLVIGVSDETIQEMSADISRYNASLSRDQQRDRVKVYRKVKKLFCSY
jgi:hypothetical protein